MKIDDFKTRKKSKDQILYLEVISSKFYRFYAVFFSDVCNTLKIALFAHADKCLKIHLFGHKIPQNIPFS